MNELLVVAPGGQPYYFNAKTNESTYVRPQEQQKKEKPKSKTPIPNTPWLRVVTTANNVFYTNKDTKESVWTVPEEIREAVEALLRKDEDEPKAADADARMEIERVKEEVKKAVVMKRKADEGPVPLDEVDISQKKARVDDADEEQEGDDSGSEEEDEEEEEEEDWQREAAAQLAAEAEAEERRRREEEEQKRLEEAEELKSRENAKGMPALNMPDRVELSLEEAKALFKVSLSTTTLSLCDILNSQFRCFRLSFEKKILTLSCLGTLLCPSLSRIRAMSYYHLLLQDARPSMNIAASACASGEQRR